RGADVQRGRHVLRDRPAPVRRQERLRRCRRRDGDARRADRHAEDRTPDRPAAALDLQPVIERDRAASVRRTLAAVAAIVVAVLPAAARAYGDPASDYLLAQNVSLPNPAPSTSTAAALVHATGAVYARGGRVK